MKRVIILLSILMVYNALTALDYGISKVQYRYLHWQITETAHFKVYYYKGEEKLIPRFVDILEQSFHELSTDFDHKPKDKIQVVLYRSGADFRQTNIINEDIDQSVGGFTEFLKQRVVIPFNGSYKDLRHVTKHELVHAFTYDFLFSGKSWSTIVKLEMIGRMPLWFAEGLAEYLSVKNMVESEMVMRDAMLHEYYIPLKDIDYYYSYLLYKEGQWFFMYLEDRYGRDLGFRLLKSYGRRNNFYKVLEDELGFDMDYLERDFSRWMKRRFWPTIDKHRDPDEIARQLTNHTKDKSSFNVASSLSPDGKYIAFLTNWKQYADIYLMKLADGKITRKIVRTETTGEFQSVDFLDLKLAWSPDSKNIAFVANSSGVDWLYIMDVLKSRVLNKYELPCDATGGPTFSSNGKVIAYRGIKEGKSDIYTIDLSSGKSIRHIFDFYDDRDPCFGPDDKYIIFSSDRSGEDYNLYKITLDNNVITPFVTAKGNDRCPFYMKATGTFLFNNDGNGIRNLALTDTSGSVTYVVSDLLGGSYSPTSDSTSKDLVFYSYNNGGWDIYAMKRARFEKIKEEFTYELEKSRLAKLEGEKAIPALKDTTKTEAKIDTTKAQVKPDTTKPKETFAKKPAEADWKDREGAKPDSAKDKDDFLREKRIKPKTDIALEPPFLYTVESIKPKEEEAEEEFPYKLRAREYTPSFSIDYLTAVMNYNTYYGFGGEALFAMSDFLSNHQIYLLTGMQGQVTDLAATLYYLYLPHRIDYGAVVFHQNQYYYYTADIPSQDIYFSDRTVGGGLFTRYPFNKFVKADLTLVSRYIYRDFYQPKKDEGKTAEIAIYTPSLSITNDTSLWNNTGPINGRRLGAEVSYAYGKDIQYSSLVVDLRKYANISNRYAFAFRLAGGGSIGKTPEDFYLGGNITDTPLLGGVDDKNKTDFKNFYLNRGDQVRGYDYFEYYGHYYGVLNTEFRFPFVDYFLLNFPLPLLISPIGGAIFCDMGGTFDKTFQFKGAEDGRLKDLLFGFGLGPRIGVGYMVFKFDWAWHTDFKSVSSPYFYFTLGADF